MSSTESEVVSANVSLRAVGLPSSGLWAYLQNAGGERSAKDSIPGGLPRRDIETQKEPNGEYWQFMRSRRLLIRVHTKPRSHLFTPIDMSKSPINLKRIGCARTTVMLKDGNGLTSCRTIGRSKLTTQSMGSGLARLSSGFTVPMSPTTTSNPSKSVKPSPTTSS